MTLASMRGILVVLAVTTAGRRARATATAGAASQPKPPSSFVATGFFHTAFVGHRWWLVDPSGHPFYSSGIDHVTASPDTDQVTHTCPYCQAVATDYPNWDTWADTQITPAAQLGVQHVGLVLRHRSPTHLPDALHGAAVDGQRRRLVRPVLRRPRRPGGLVAGRSSRRPQPGRLLHRQRAALGTRLARRRSPSSTTTWPCPPGSPGRTVADRYVGNPSGFLFALAQRYFSVTTAAVHRYDPNHLILGVKAVAQLIEPELLEAARPYVDVWSVDDYAILGSVATVIAQQWPAYLPDAPGMGAIERVVGRPIMVGRVRLPGRRQRSAQHLATSVPHLRHPARPGRGLRPLRPASLPNALGGGRRLVRARRRARGRSRGRRREQQLGDPVDRGRALPDPGRQDGEGARRLTRPRAPARPDLSELGGGRRRTTHLHRPRPSG